MIYTRLGCLAAALAVHVPCSAMQAQDASPASPLTTRLAVVNDATVCQCTAQGVPAPRARDLLIVAVGRSMPVATGAGGSWDLAYTPELLPLVVSRRTADERLEVWSCGHKKYCGQSSSSDVWSVTAVGLGILPLSGTFRLRLDDALRLRLRLSGGAVRLSRPVPLAQGSKFNFVAEGSAGAEVRVSRKVALTAGVIYNHISNGGMTPVNLGMDSRLIELGALIGR
jgi:hypothetical protein